MPVGKPAGVRCVHLNEDFRCDLFLDPRRPKICGQFQPELDFCGDSREQALRILTDMEASTLTAVL